MALLGSSIAFESSGGHLGDLGDGLGQFGATDTEATEHDVGELQQVAVGGRQRARQVLGGELLGLDQHLADTHALCCSLARHRYGRLWARQRSWCVR